MAKYAVIDIGTNSIKFHIAQKDEQGNWSVLLDETAITRLGDGFRKTGHLLPEVMKRNVKAISEMVRVARQHDVSEIVATGTMCLRSAHNADEFIRRVKDACGVTVEVLPGEEEARLSYLAVQSGLESGEGRIVIFDTGGGSTEFIFGQGKNLERRFSLDVGAVRYTEDFLRSDPVTRDELHDAIQAVEHELTPKLQTEAPVPSLLGIGGGVTTLSAVNHQLTEYDAEVVDGSVLTLRDIETQITLYQSKTIEDRKQIPGLQPGRADVILAGAIIVRVIMQQFKAMSFTVSDRGLRHGVIVDRFY